MPTFDDLPKPNANALARSRKLVTYLRDEMAKAGGSISFERYMADALYHPTLGYYTSPDFTIGPRGDFTTAAELTPLYAQCMANTCATVFRELTEPAILEIGAGSGQFAVDLLQALHALNALPTRYFIHEISPALRDQQAEKLKQHCPQWLNRIEWCDTLPQFEGMIIANEVLDALPVHCFEMNNETIYERRVTFADQAFAWTLTPPTPSLKQALNELTDLAFHTQGEMNLQYAGFIKTLANCLTRGLMLFADYGYGRPLLYHPARVRGTLTCFYQHHHHDNPLILPGLQDITAHVDFTRVAEAGVAAGCDLAGFTTQAAFLLESGLTSLIVAAEQPLNEKEKFKLHQAVKTLTLPTEMGEVIKIMGLTKGIEHRLAGMSMADRRGEL
jgi:SAM-dependent MidA family methyltransferase